MFEISFVWFTFAIALDLPRPSSITTKNMGNNPFLINSTSWRVATNFGTILGTAWMNIKQESKILVLAILTKNFISSENPSLIHSAIFIMKIDFPPWIFLIIWPMEIQDFVGELFVSYHFTIPEPELIVLTIEFPKYHFTYNLKKSILIKSGSFFIWYWLTYLFLGNWTQNRENWQSCELNCNQYFVWSYYFEAIQKFHGKIFCFCVSEIVNYNSIS